jgi:hypothetical protein
MIGETFQSEFHLTAKRFAWREMTYAFQRNTQLKKGNNSAFLASIWPVNCRSANFSLING